MTLFLTKPQNKIFLDGIQPSSSLHSKKLSAATLSIEFSSDKEKIISAIATIDSMLALDFMTDPVRADLNSIKTLLEQVRDNLSSYDVAYLSSKRSLKNKTISLKSDPQKDFFAA